jgi:hypothetical protein
MVEMLQLLPGARLSYGFETITPQRAAELLEHDVRVRVPNEARIGDMSRDMTARAWRINGEAIVLGRDGFLLDGRKRLLACVRSVTSFTTLVVHGVDDDASLSLDSRKTRALGDVLTAGGWEHGRTLNTTLKFIARMADGGWNVRVRRQSNVLHSVLKSHPEISGFLSGSMRPGRRCSPALHAALHFVLSRIDSSGADAFFDAVYDPDGHKLSARDPRRMLAQRLADIAERRVRMEYRDIAAMFVSAWNAHRLGQKGLALSGPQDAFPEIDGWHEGCAISLDAMATPADPALCSEDAVGGLRIQVQHVGPELASMWLEENTSNRRLSPRTVERYGRDMSAGKWKLTGETVKFGRSGRLLDGQHRLRAVVRSGETVAMLVVEGLDEGVFDTLDIGERRSFPAILAERGMRQPGTVAAALKLVLCTERNVDMRGFLPTNEELEDGLARHPGLQEAVDDAGAKPMEPSLAVAVSYLFARSDKDKAAQFLRKVRGLGTFDENDPVWHLRQRLSTGRRDSQPGGDTSSTNLSLAITAWNAFRRGRKLGKLVVKQVPGHAYPDIL